jgi:hypothetical protein
MGRRRRSLAELSAAWHHIEYEVSMFEHCALNLGDTDAGRSAPETNALLEAFTLHVRALVEFLFSREPREEDMIADEYVRDVAAWERERGELRDQAGLLARVGPKAGKGAAHLTFIRAEPGPEAKGWPTDEVADSLRSVIAIFLRHRIDLHPVPSPSSVGSPSRPTSSKAPPRKP